MQEWLETNGLGGFALGTRDLIPRRKYHALLIDSLNSPVQRIAVAHMPEVLLQTGRGIFPLQQFSFVGGLADPTRSHQQSFSATPFPSFTWLVDGITVTLEVILPRDSRCVLLRWSTTHAPGATLLIRPFFSLRDMHQVRQRTDDLASGYGPVGEQVWSTVHLDRRYHLASNASQRLLQPLWYYNFHYAEEQARGYEYTEHLYAPACYTFEISPAHDALVAIGTLESLPLATFGYRLQDFFANQRERELTRRTDAHRTAAEHFIVKRGEGTSIIAGYPWFADWGRDTAIAVRGLCIARGDITTAVAILRTWGERCQDGLIPNRFIEEDNSCEYNSVDAALWWVVAAYECLTHANSPALPSTERDFLRSTIASIAESYLAGTRHHIGCDPVDGLLRCGDRSIQLTWMDAKVGEYVVTPRAGKPVEIQALWFNLLTICAKLQIPLSFNAAALAQKVSASFNQKFPIPGADHLYDVVDVDHQAGIDDPTMRPNQLFAAGGLPFTLVAAASGARMLTAAAKDLLTPMGMRSLAPSERGYSQQYLGDEPRRNFAYHQGTIWPWLLGAFIEGWARYHDDGSAAAISRAATRFLEPLATILRAEHLPWHILPEIADAAMPHCWRGCPAQAWSVGEILRLAPTAGLEDPCHQ